MEKDSEIAYQYTQTVRPESSDDKYPSKFCLQSVSGDYVEMELNKLNDKAVDLDRIITRFLKDAASVIAPVLTNLINKSISSRCFIKVGNPQKYSRCFKMEKELQKRNIDLSQSYQRLVKLLK